MKSNLKYLRKQRKKRAGIRSKVGIRNRGDGKKFYEMTLPLKVAKQMKIKDGDFVVWRYDPLTHSWYIKLEEDIIGKENDKNM